MRESTRSRTVRIYGLRRVGDPIKYVGQTTLPLAQRLTKHGKTAREGSPFSVHAWIRAVGADSVEIVELECCDFEDRHAREAHWTAELRTLATQGGLNESLGKLHSVAVRAKIRDAWEDDRREAMAALTHSRNVERWADYEYRAKISQVGRTNMARGRHTRWHVDRAVVSDSCEFCATSERAATGS